MNGEAGQVGRHISPTQRAKIVAHLRETDATIAGIARYHGVTRETVRAIRASCVADGLVAPTVSPPKSADLPAQTRETIRAMTAAGASIGATADAAGVSYQAAARARRAAWLRDDPAAAAALAAARLSRRDDDDDAFPAADHDGFLDLCRAAYPDGPPADARPSLRDGRRLHPSLLPQSAAPAGCASSPAALCAELGGAAGGFAGGAS